MDTWGVIAEERAAILDTFEALTPEQWDQPSLCGQWTVRDLLGHLIVAADPPKMAFVRAFAAARGSFDRANDVMARTEAQRPIDELVSRYRARIPVRSTPPGFGPEAPLTDVIVHGFDLRVPIGIAAPDRPAARYETAMALLLGVRGGRTFVPSGRPKLRWVANDHDWSAGSGDEVHGTMADLVLAASGRGARVDELSGPGQPALAAWLQR